MWLRKKDIWNDQQRCSDDILQQAAILSMFFFNYSYVFNFQVTDTSQRVGNCGI